MAAKIEPGGYFGRRLEDGLLISTSLSSSASPVALTEYKAFFL